MLTRSHKMFLWVLKHNCQQALIISRVVNATKNIQNIQNKIKMKRAMIESKYETIVNYWEKILD